MEIPYTITELDDLLGACIEFTELGDPYFWAGNIGGRNGVSADNDVVKRMLYWVSEMDKTIIEYTGIGKDNVPYFRLGLGGRQMMAGGGFGPNFRRKKMIEGLEQLRLWAPIGISLLALVVSFLAWQAPKGNSKRIDELSGLITALQIDQAQTKATVDVIRAGFAAAPRLRGGAEAAPQKGAAADARKSNETHR